MGNATVEIVREGHIRPGPMIFVTVRADVHQYEIGTMDGHEWSTLHGPAFAGRETTAIEAARQWAVENPVKMQSLIGELERQKKPTS